MGIEERCLNGHFCGGQGVVAVCAHGGVPSPDPGWGCVAEDADCGDEGGQPERGLSAKWCFWPDTPAQLAGKVM